MRNGAKNRQLLIVERRSAKSLSCNIVQTLNAQAVRKQLEWNFRLSSHSISAPQKEAEMSVKFRLCAKRKLALNNTVTLEAFNSDLNIEKLA